MIGDQSCAGLPLHVVRSTVVPHPLLPPWTSRHWSASPPPQPWMFSFPSGPVPNCHCWSRAPSQLTISSGPVWVPGTGPRHLPWFLISLCAVSVKICASFVAPQPQLSTPVPEASESLRTSRQRFPLLLTRALWSCTVAPAGHQSWLTLPLHGCRSTRMEEALLVGTSRQNDCCACSSGRIVPFCVIHCWFDRPLQGQSCTTPFCGSPWLRSRQ